MCLRWFHSHLKSIECVPKSAAKLARKRGTVRKQVKTKPACHHLGSSSSRAMMGTCGQSVVSREPEYMDTPKWRGVLCYQVLAIVAACELGSGLPVFSGSLSDSVGLKEVELRDSHWTDKWYHNKDNSDQWSGPSSPRAILALRDRVRGELHEEERPWPSHLFVHLVKDCWALVGLALVCTD